MKVVSRSIAVATFVAVLTLPAHAAETYPAWGKINQVDAVRNKVNITHGPIVGLGWPGMTMTFQVADKAATKALKPGEAIRFWLEMRGDHYVITRVEPANAVK